MTKPEFRMTNDENRVADGSGTLSFVCMVLAVTALMAVGVTVMFLIHRHWLNEWLRGLLGLGLKEPSTVFIWLAVFELGTISAVTFVFVRRMFAPLIRHSRPHQ